MLLLLERGELSAEYSGGGEVCSDVVEICCWKERTDVLSTVNGTTERPGSVCGAVHQPHR